MTSVSLAQHPDLTSKILLKDNWFVQESAIINKSGHELSTDELNTANWYKAIVPSTIMGVLTRNGEYKDLFVGENYKKIDKAKFDGSWWYVREINTPGLVKSGNVILHFEGLNYYANIWLNGKLIASRDSIYGPYRRYAFDITRLISKKRNVLAVEVFRAQPGDFNLGFVDWNIKPADENMGIWREVYLGISGDVGINNTYVQTKVNNKTLNEATLTIKTDLKNYSSKTADGILKGKIGTIEFSYPVIIKPGEIINLSITSKQIPALNIKNPRLWWCNNLGSPELYQLNLSYELRKQITGSEKITFGIRDIESYTNEAGHTGYKLNGKEVLIKGAGWTDDIFLRDSLQNLEIQVQYVKHMNLNTLRFESIWGTNHDIYDLCDKYGILTMVGWSCQWEWEEYLGKSCDDFGGIQTEKEMALATNSLHDQILWLRNHPGLFVWMVGSDKLPKPELELKYQELIKKLDNRSYLAAASMRISEVSGSTGVKMNGPYEYVTPNYWYIDSIHGGAFGFNTETGPGPQVPVLESLKKMIPSDKLWPLNDTWNYHCTKSKEEFNTMDVFNNVLDNRYGKPTNLDEYLIKSNAQSYESLKAMFEAFRVNIPNTTGIIQWMLNSAWPSLYWQLFDYYLKPTAAYYAARKANQPIQLIYNYGNNAIYAVNETQDEGQNLKASLKILNINSKELVNNELNFNIAPNTSKKIIQLDSINESVFLDLKLSNIKGDPIADNFYWLSDDKDEFAWDKTYWAYTPLKAYTDFSGLNSMHPAEVLFSYDLKDIGDDLIVKAHLKNPAQKIAFFLTLKITDKQGNLIYPLFWEDNYFSLLPEEKRDVTCSIPKRALNGNKIEITLSGWNINQQKLLIE